MLRFVDRQGRELSLRQWQLLLRDPDYTQVAQRRLDSVLITATWLGVVVAGEREPRPYLVTVRAKKRPKLHRDIWCRDETHAQAEIDLAVADVSDLLSGVGCAKERA